MCYPWFNEAGWASENLVLTLTSTAWVVCLASLVAYGSRTDTACSRAWCRALLATLIAGTGGGLVLANVED